MKTALPIPKQIAAIRSAVNGYKLSQVLMTVEELGVFSALSVQPLPLELLGATVSCPPSRLQPLVDALVAHGFLARGSEGYSIASGFSTLDVGHPASQLGYLRYASTVSGKWKRLGDAARATTVAEENFAGITGGDAAHTEAFTAAMHANAAPQVAFLRRNFDFAGRSILDVGGGRGTYSVAAAKEWPACSAEILDLPSVAELAKEAVQEEGVSANCSVILGDYLSTLPNGPYDDVFLFAVIHQHSSEETLRLLTEIRRRLRPGGRLLLSSFFLDDDRTSPPFSVMFAIEMLVMVPDGRVYTHSELEQLLKKAGFSDPPERRDDVPGPATWYIAHV